MAVPLWFDRVWETSTTTGTGAFTLLGAAQTNMRRWGSVLSVGDTAYGFIEDVSGTEWEVNLFTMQAGGTLARGATPLASSNGGALVNFSAGVKNVVLDEPADVIRRTATYPSGNGAFGQIAYSDGTGGLLFNNTLFFTPPASPSVLSAEDMLGIGHISVGSEARINNPSPIPFLSNQVYTAIIMLADAVNGQQDVPATTVAVGIANHIDYDLLQDATYPYYAYDGQVISRVGNTFNQGSVAVVNGQFLNLATGDFTSAIGVAMSVQQDGPAASNVAYMAGFDLVHGAGNGGTVTVYNGIHLHSYTQTLGSATSTYVGIQIDPPIGGSLTNVTGIHLGNHAASTTGATGFSRSIQVDGGTIEVFPGDNLTTAMRIHRNGTFTTSVNQVEFTNNVGTVVSGFRYDWAWWPVHRTEAQAVNNDAVYFSTDLNFLNYKDAGGTNHNLQAGNIGDVVVGGTANSVLFVGTGAVLAQDNTNFTWVESTKTFTLAGGGFPTFVAGPANHAALGPQALVDDITLFYPGQTISSVLDVAQVFTSTVPNSLQGITSYIYLNPGDDLGAFAVGVDGQALTLPGNAHNFGFVYGVRAAAKHRGLGTVSQIYGCAGIVFNSHEGTVFDAIGLYAQVNNLSTGPVTSGYGLRVDATNGGAYTNVYGVYIADQTGATASGVNANLYSAGVNSFNYFGGVVAVGTTTPSALARVQINSDAVNHIPLVVRGFSGQANNASFFQMQKDDGTVLVSMEEDTITSTGGVLSIHADNGTMTGQFRTNVGGGTSGMDITAYNSLHLVNLNAGTFSVIPSQPTDWLVYGGNLLKFAGYTGFGGTVSYYDRNSGNTIITALLTADDPGGPSLGVTQWSAGVTPFFVRGAASQSAVLCQLQGISSTSAAQPQADLDTAWVDATNATRKARFLGRVWDTAAREFLRADSDGTQALLGVGGAVTAATKLTVHTGADTNVGVLVQANSATQSADLQQWQDSGGNVRASIMDLGGGAGLYLSNSPGQFFTTLQRINSVGYGSYTEFTQGDRFSIFTTAGINQIRMGGQTGGIIPFVLDAAFTSVHRLLIDTSDAASIGVVIRGFASQSAVICQLHGISSTSADREQADLDTAWVDATDATRKARFIGRVWDTAAREFMRAEGSGTVAKLGFFGANAVVQPASTGETVGFTAGTGTTVHDDSTFTGNIGATAYRISDIVKALKQLGLLAQ